MTKVSVIMPSLNTKPFINECLESVINQSLKDIEIICVDAGSIDGTLEEIEKYAKCDKRIRVVKSPKKSYGYQMNLGISLAKGEYIGIVETDDYIDGFMYEKLYTAAKENYAEIVKSNFSRFINDGEERIFYPAKIANNKNYYNILLNPQEKPELLKTVFYTWAAIYSHEFLRNNNILHNETPGASYQDNGFFFLTTINCQRMFVITDDLYKLRRDNPGSSLFNKKNIYAICDEYNFIYDVLRKSPEKNRKFMAGYWFRKFHNYYFTLNRIALIYVLEFLERFSKEFKTAYENNELIMDYISENKNDVKKLFMIIDNYEAFFYKLFYNDSLLITPKNDKETLQNMEHMYKCQMYENTRLIEYHQRLESSNEYKIGKIIMCLPRKIWGFLLQAIEIRKRVILYYRENGLILTIKKIFNRKNAF